MLWACILLPQLALGRNMPDAAALANRYTHQFLASNDSLLGYHYQVHSNTSYEKNK